MTKIVVAGAKIQCNFGSEQNTMCVVTTSHQSIENKKIATINDTVPGACITSFGQCCSPLNPAVMAANLAGEPAPPCSPITAEPWTPGATNVSIMGIPVLVENAKASCIYGPMAISITDPGQTKVDCK